MNDILKNKYLFDWVLVNELAVGKAPKKLSDLLTLKEEGIISILSLCSKEEVAEPSELKEMFISKRLVLPDHKYKRKLQLEEFILVLETLSELIKNGPVLVHCVAAIERSPLVCMGWLIKNYGLSPQESLDYLMQTHPGTNPLPDQFKILKNI